MGSGGPAIAPDAEASDHGLRLEHAWHHIQALLPGSVPLEGPRPTFLIPQAESASRNFPDLQRRLAPLGLLPLLRLQDGRPTLVLMPKSPPGRWSWRTNALLLLATVATTFYAGYLQSLSLVQAGLLDSAVAGGIAFSASLLAILGAHEMGHKLVAVRRGIDASLPYFLPMAPPIGTMGAVIVTRTPAPDRNSLMDLGASGPIAGFLVAIPVLWYGVSHSFVVGQAPTEHLIAIPDPLLIRLMIRLLLNPAPDALVLGHPALFAGWIGLVVTSINLLPAGMLDGGHAIRAALGPRAHQALSYVGLALAVLMGFYPMALLIALLMRRGHAGPLDDLSPLTPSRRLMGVALVIIFALSAVILQPLLGR